MTPFKQNSRHLAISTVAIATVASVALALGVAHAQSPAPAAATAAPQASATAAPKLNIAQVYERVIQAGYQDVRSIDMDDGRYEVDARDAQGQLVELYVNASTGEIEHSKLDD